MLRVPLHVEGRGGREGAEAVGRVEEVRVGEGGEDDAELGGVWGEQLEDEGEEGDVAQGVHEAQLRVGVDLPHLQPKCEVCSVQCAVCSV